MDQQEFTEEVSEEIARNIALARVDEEIAQLEAERANNRPVSFDRLVALHGARIKLLDPTAGLAGARGWKSMPVSREYR